MDLTTWIVSALAWVFLGYWGAAATARWITTDQSGIPERQLWDVMDKIAWLGITAIGVIGFLISVLFVGVLLNEWRCFFRPLWSWPVLKYRNPQ